MQSKGKISVNHLSQVELFKAAGYASQNIRVGIDVNPPPPYSWAIRALLMSAVRTLGAIFGTGRKHLVAFVALMEYG